MNTAVNEKAVEKLSSCPSCGSTTLKFFGPPKIWIDREHFADVEDQLGLSKCQHCGLVITNPRPGESLLVDFYNKPGYQCHELHFGAAQESDASARFEILERLTAKGVLLDYGCGSGNMLKAGIARRWPRVVGVEIGENARNKLLREGFEVYRDFSTAASLNGEVEVLTMIQVLEHLPDLSAVLSDVSRMLRPDGLFVVEVPNAGSLRARIAGSKLALLFSRPVQRYQAFPIHLYHFEWRTLLGLLDKHGFKTIAIHTLGMGVEELLPPPRAVNPRELVQTPPKSPAVVRTSGSSPRFLKKSIKSAMSGLRLGEQLFLVCRKQTAD